MYSLWFNGTIYTMRREGECVEAVITQGEKIVDCGALTELRKKYGYSIQAEIDLEGRTMFPGFVDSHMHLIGHGETFLRLNLSGMRSRREVLRAVAGQAELLPPGEWIIGEGWDENGWGDKTVLTLKELDDIAPDHPVLLKRTCRHAMAVNSNAMNIAGIEAGTPNPPGGVIDRYPDGTLTGILKDEAQNLIVSVLPGITDQYVESALEAGIRDCWKLGLTGAHTEDLSYYGSYRRTIQSFDNILNKKGLPFRAHLLVHHKVAEEWREGGHGYLSKLGSIEFGAMKIFVDGALGGRTALLSHPYKDDPGNSGMAVHSEESLCRLVKQAREYGLPVAAHVIGDKAFELMLDLLGEFPPPRQTKDRLIHGQILRKDLIDRAKLMPVAVDIQPRFTASDFPWVMERVGKDRTDYLYAWKTLLSSGILCAGGSDAPIEPADPLLGIHAAVTRSNPADPSKRVYIPEQRLTVYESLSLFTKGSAAISGHGRDRGVIQPGFAADFTVLDRDLFEIDEHEIPAASAAMTVIGGKIVYSS
ncbi:MAG TPA: amidohydrolase [Bacillaceae bacterium]